MAWGWSAFEYFRKITLTASLWKTKRSRDSRTSEEQHRPFKETGTTTIFSLGYQSGESFRKITLTASLWKARRSRDSRNSEEQHRPFKETGTTTIFSLGSQSCAWPCSGPFCWQNPCFGCISGINLVVFLDYTFFQLW